MILATLIMAIGGIGGAYFSVKAAVSFTSDLRDDLFSKVQEFLRLTVEIDAGDAYGPHGQKIGKFDEASESIFYVDYVKVWQNENYTPYQIDDAKFPGELDLAN